MLWKYFLVWNISVLNQNGFPKMRSYIKDHPFWIKGLHGVSLFPTWYKGAGIRNTEVEKGNKTKIKRQIQELVVEDGLWSWSLIWQMMFNPRYIL